MYISIKNQKNFPNEDFSTISQYLLSDKFRRQLEYDYSTCIDEQSRIIWEIDKHVFLIRHSEFSIQSIESALEELHLSSVERYGLIDLYQVGIDSNKNSILYWIVFAKSIHVLQTHLGLICKNSDSVRNIPNMLARFDHLWLAGTSSSTVLALDQGSSHVVT